MLASVHRTTRPMYKPRVQANMRRADLEFDRAAPYQGQSRKRFRPGAHDCGGYVLGRAIPSRSRAGTGVASGVINVRSRDRRRTLDFQGIRRNQLET